MASPGPVPLPAIGGFTLIEVLAAIMVFAILIGAVFGAFLSIHHSAEALQYDDAYYASARTALARMTEDLRSLYVTRPPLYSPPGIDTPPDPYRVVAGAPSGTGAEAFPTLRFTSLSHVAINGQQAGGVAEITYYAHAEGETDRITLRRADHLFPYPDSPGESGNDPVLCENLMGLSFKFYTSDGNIEDTWDSESNDHGHATPRAVTITLKVGDDTHSVTLQTTVLLPVYREELP
jgi:general secretion pathway protein J